mgnify:CR=1 FL=1
MTVPQTSGAVGWGRGRSLCLPWRPPTLRLLLVRKLGQAQRPAPTRTVDLARSVLTGAAGDTGTHDITQHKGGTKMRQPALTRMDDTR